VKHAVLTSILLAAACTAAAGEARYVIESSVLPANRDVNGFQQRVRVLGPNRAEVEIIARMEPIEARGFSMGQPEPAASTPSWFQMPRSLGQSISAENDPWERATLVLRWVMEHVRLDAEDRAPQDAGSVLERGSGRCSGLANAAAAMLGAAGFPARTVSGILVSGSRVVPHRWLECRLPGAGWVPTDPTLGFWIVTPRHMAWPEPVTGSCTVQEIEAADMDLGEIQHAWGWPIRVNRGAILECRVVGERGAEALMAELQGPNGEIRKLRLDGDGQFGGLPPGRWFLTVRLGGRIIEKCMLRLEEGKTVSFSIKLPDPEVG